MKKMVTDSPLFKIYLKQISRFPLLSREEEKEYAQKVQQGDQGAKEKLITSNLRFVVTCAVKYQNMGLPLMDLINEGNMGLMRAVEKFDVNRGIRFISYARWWIRHYMLKALFEQSTSIKIPIKYASRLSKRDEEKTSNFIRSLENLYKPLSLNRSLSEEEDSDTVMDLVQENSYAAREETVARNQLKELIDDVLYGLKPVERDVIRRHFGLNGIKPHTLKEIGERHNLTKERIRQIEIAALGKLRYPMQKKKLMDLVNQEGIY